MATVNLNVDVAAIIHELWSIVGAVKDEKRAEKDRQKDAQLLVYTALSLHPALNFMRPPTGILGDVDWYTELRSPLFSRGIFRKLGYLLL